MEEVHKKELGAMKWLIRLTERLTILTTSIRIKTDLGLTEDDVEMIRALHRIRELGYVPMHETIVINKEEDCQSTTQANLFHESPSLTADINDKKQKNK